MISLTKNERAVLEAFWESDVSLCVKNISECHPKLNKNTIPVVIKRLVKKNFLEVDHIGKHNKALTQYFKPTLTKEEFVQNQLSTKNLTQIMANFIESNDSDEDLDYFEKLIAKKREALRGENK